MLQVIEIAIFGGLLGCFVLSPVTVRSLPCESEKAVVQRKALKEGCEVTIEGRVLGREPRPEGVADGDLALRVATEDYGEVNVVYSSFRLCHNEVGASMKVGDRIQVYGKVVSEKRITVCLSKDYYLKKL